MPVVSRATRALAPLLAAAFAASGCHPNAAKDGTTGQTHVITPPPPTDPVPGLLPSKLVARLDDDAATTLFARRSDGGLVLYSSRGRWWARTVDKDGAPLATATAPGAPPPAEDVGPATDLAPGLGALKATQDGYLAVWAEVVAENRAVKILSLDARGRPRGAPVLVTQVGDPVRWVDVLPNEKSALVLWEIPRGDRMEVDVVPVVSGKTNGTATQLLKDAVGWEAIATARGAAIAAVLTDGTAAASQPAEPARKPGVKVRASDGEPTGAGKTGRVVLLEVDVAGHAAAPAVVSPAGSAQVDVQIAEVDGRYLLAWTDERDLDGAVYVAALARGGRVLVAPRRATSPFGEQALVSLVGQTFEVGAEPEGKRALLAWEEVAHGAASETRLVHLASVGVDGALGSERATLALAANGPPDIVPDGAGWAVTTLAPQPEAAEEKQGPHSNSAPKNREIDPEVVPVWPAFVRLAADLSVRGAEPLRAAPFPPDFVPDLTRALSCKAGSCLTMATGGGAGAPLALVSLPTRPSTWRPAAQRDADDTPPRATAAIALGSGDHVAKVAASEVAGGAKLAAWVTYFVPGGNDHGMPHDKRKHAEPPPEKDDAPAARLEVRPIAVGPAALANVQKPVLISQRAYSIGGVSLAPAPAVGNKPAETVLAWVGKERGEPQVFVTKLAADGKKIAQKGVTVIPRKKQGKGGIVSEASDVAAAFDGQDGWIVGWVDTRDGDPEVYVAKVDRSMTKVIPDKRITDAVGDASDVALLVRGKETWLAWSDARGNDATNSGDIYLSRLDTATLKPLGPERHVFASKENSRSPEFTETPSGVLLSSIEAEPESKTGASDPEAGLRVAELDDHGAVIGAPYLVRAPGEGTITSAHLACPQKPCRGVVTIASKDAVDLAAFTLGASLAQLSRLKTISALTGGATGDPSLAFASSDPTALFFSDDTTGGQGRVRWMQIAWP